MFLKCSKVLANLSLDVSMNKVLIKKRCICAIMLFFRRRIEMLCTGILTNQRPNGITLTNQKRGRERARLSFPRHSA